MPNSSIRLASSVYSDDFSLEYLVQEVNESLRLSELISIEQLAEENRMLKGELGLCERHWDGLMTFLDEIITLFLLIQTSFGELESRFASAEKEWLSAWGIGEGSELAIWF